MPMIHGDNAASPCPHAKARTPPTRYHAPAIDTARGNNRHEAKIPRLNNNAHKPGNIQTESLARSHDNDGEQSARH